MSEYQSPDRCCDLVMKGGITSGILYPHAICRIAEKFHLVGIGGTSAGAIVACIAAAAEYRRRCHNDPSGFEKLETLPDQLAGDGNLTGLFRPDRKTRRIHDLLLQALTLKDKGWFGRLWFGLRAGWFGLRCKKRLRPMVENGLGLCSGMAIDNRPGAGEIAPLTEWLSAQIEEVAGPDGPDGRKREGPLTFADLWGAPVPEKLAGTIVAEDRSIDLRAITTCVTFGRPYEMPFTDKLFAFDPKEWKLLFPDYVTEYLIARAKEIDAPTLERDGKLPLPTGGAMPVIVAARMSLSFPGLFSMIPLYAVDYEGEKNADGKRPLKKVWFSDGGITSNLPSHRFDGLFPRWPTLVINLQYTDENGKPARSSMGESMIYMIQRRNDGIRDLWHVFDGKSSPVSKLIGFAGAIFRSAQVWHDNAFLRLPGYRDRMVEIWLTPDEGGLNLEMPECTIRGLIQRGNEAGIRLRDRFLNEEPGEPLSWDGHRWARLRSGLAGLATFLHAFKRAVDHPMPADRKLEKFLESVNAPPCYRLEADQLIEARKAIRDILKLVGDFQDSKACGGAPDRPFCEGPRPAVEIGSRAPM